MARSAGHLPLGLYMEQNFILGPMVTNGWCINWIRHRIYSDPCWNRRDSPFAAHSLSTDTPNVTGKKTSTRSGRDFNQGPLADRASNRTTELPSHAVDP